MAQSVDEKVVQLTLDSKQFNDASSDTINSLDKLKKALEFEGAIDAFDKLDKDVKKVDFSPLSDGVQSLSKQFTFLDTIVDATLRNMTNRIIDTGERMIKSLSVDQITNGWDQYAERTGAVQTIMAATAQQFSDTETQMEAVNSQLDKLTWFTDETSHKFNDMVSGIGKFTANNIDLETSVKAMEGIATWASISGANTNEASRAIYNLAQAISVGSVKLIDWRSIENANMGTTEFKQTVIETAEEIGVLTKVTDNLWKTLDGKDVSIANFSENLSTGWFNSEVLLKALEAYGGFADQLNQFVDETGILTATAINYIDDYVEGTIDMGEAMRATGLDAESLTEWLEKLSSEQNNLGRRAFKAAQETKTFAEAIDYVKTAVSSGWATSFQYIFGDYIEAKEWWSEIAEIMYDIFVVGGEIRNQILSLWKDKGGRDDFLQAIREGLENIIEIVDIFKETWNEVWFGDEEEQIENQANALIGLTKGLLEFVRAVKPTEITLDNLRRILKSVFSAFQTGVDVFKALAKGLSPILNILNNLSGILVQVIADFSEFISSGISEFFNEERLNKISNALTFIAEVLSGTIRLSLVVIFSVIQKLSMSISDLIDRFRQSGGGIKGIFITLKEIVVDFWNSFTNGQTMANRIADSILYIFVGLLEGLKSIVKSVVGLLTGELSFDDIFNGIGGPIDVIKGFGKILDNLNLKDKFDKITGWIKNFTDSLIDADKIIVEFVNGIVGAVVYLYEKLRFLIDQIDIDDIKDFLLIAILWKFVSGINGVGKALEGTVKNIGGSFKALTGVFNYFADKKEGVLDKLTSIFNKTLWLQIGIAVAIVVASLEKLNTLDYVKTQQSVAALGVTMTVLLAAFTTFNKIINKLPKKEESDDAKEKINLFGVNLMAISAGVLMITKALETINNTFFNSVDKFDIKKFIFDIGTIGLIMTSLVAVFKILDGVKFGNALSSLAMILGFTTGIKMVVTSIGVLTKFDSDKLIIAAGGVSLIILALGESVNLMKNINWKSALSVIPLMLSFSTSLTVLVGALAILSSLVDSGHIWTALGVFNLEVAGMTASLIALGTTLRKVKPSTIMSIGLALIEFSTAFTILAGAMKMIERYDFDSSQKSLTALGIGFVAITTSLGTLGIALKSVNPSTIISIGFAMDEFAASIVILAQSLRMIQGIKWEDISDGVLTVGALIGVFSALSIALGVVGSIFTGGTAEAIGKGISYLGDGFLKFGAAVAALSAGIFLLSAATGLFAGIIGAIQSLASVFGIDLPEMVQSGFDTMELIVKEFLEMLRNLAPDFLATFVMLFGVIATAIEMTKHPTATAIVGVILAIADTINKHGQDIVDALVSLIRFVTNAKDLFSALEDLVGTIANFIGVAFIRAICGVMGGVVEGILQCFGIHLDGAKEEISDTYTEIMTEAISRLNDPELDAATKESAVQTIESIVNGLENASYKLDESLKQQGLDAVAEYKREVGQAAYSAGEGIAKQIDKGIKSNYANAKKSGKTLGDNVWAGWTESLDPAEPYDKFYDAAFDMVEQLKSGANASGGEWSSVGSWLGNVFGEGVFSAAKAQIDKLLNINLVTGSGGGSKKQTNAEDLAVPTAMNNTARSRLALAKKNAEQTGKEVGTSAGNAAAEAYTDTLSKGIKSGGSKTSKAAKESADTVANAFADEIDRINRESQIQDKLYKLWTAQNPTATEMEKQAKEIEYQTQKVVEKVKLAEIAQIEYQKTLKEMGESAKETQEAYSKMLDTQIEVLELQNKLAELQDSYNKSIKDPKFDYFDKEAEKALDADIKTYYDAFNKWEPYFDYLQDVGYDYSHIILALKKDLGQDFGPNNFEDLDAIRRTMYDILERGANSQGILEQYGKLGEDIVTNGLVEGIDDSIPYLEDSLWDLSYSLNDDTYFDNTFSQYYNSGKNALDGLSNGLNDPTTRADLMNTVNGIGVGLYSTFNDSVGIHSPSTMFETSGKMIDAGIIKGMKDNKSEVINAAIEVALAAYRASLDALEINSPSKKMEYVGQYFDKGLAKGIDNYSYTVERSTREMVDDMMHDSRHILNQHKNEVNDYLQKIFALDDDRVHMTVVVDADTSKADNQISELERLRTIGMGTSPGIGVQSGYSSQGELLLKHISDEEMYRSKCLQELYNLAEGFMHSSDSIISKPIDDATVVNLNYTQNNTSPKALSRTEIYRDTQRQLNTFASKFGVVKKR